MVMTWAVFSWVEERYGGREEMLGRAREGQNDLKCGSPSSIELTIEEKGEWFMAMFVTQGNRYIQWF